MNSNSEYLKIFAKEQHLPGLLPIQLHLLRSHSRLSGILVAGGNLGTVPDSDQLVVLGSSLGSRGLGFSSGLVSRLDCVLALFMINPAASLPGKSG